MNKLIMVFLLSGCASMQEEFMRGYNSVNGPGGAGDTSAAYTNHMVRGFAELERSDLATASSRTEEIKMIPQQRECVPQIGYKGEYLGCF